MRHQTMKKLIIVLAILRATVSFAEKPDSTSLRILKEDQAHAQERFTSGAQLDSMATVFHGRAQQVRGDAQEDFKMASKRFQRANHLKPGDLLQADTIVRVDTTKPHSTRKN